MCIRLEETKLSLFINNMVKHRLFYYFLVDSDMLYAKWKTSTEKPAYCIIPFVWYSGQEKTIGQKIIAGCQVPALWAGIEII